MTWQRKSSDSFASQEALQSVTCTDSAFKTHGKMRETLSEQIQPEARRLDCLK